jgi:hypothetical protein
MDWPRWINHPLQIGGADPFEVQRVVWWHWCCNPRKFWRDTIKTVADLLTHFGQMQKECPEFKQQYTMLPPGRELKRIEAALAKERMLAGRKIDPRKNFSRGRAKDNATAAVGMSRPMARKLEAIVRKADDGDSEARAALDAVNEDRMSVDAAYRKVAAPEPARDAAGIKKDERTARDFNFKCKAHALDAEVFRDEREGRFRLTMKDLTRIQVSRLLEFLESCGGSKRNPSRPDSMPRRQPLFS